MILVEDHILPENTLMGIRQSALDSGFGTWAPPSHSFGKSSYTGMNWKGHHAALHVTLSKILRAQVYPNSSFFRILTQEEEPRLIHSDRNDGDMTAIVYLSNHTEKSGTSFYRHIETGLTEHPVIETLSPEDAKMWQNDSKDDSKWEETDFIRGELGKILIFSAPLFHARVPKQGIGSSPETARMIWVCHFMI